MSEKRLPKLSFGNTGHLSTRTIFGAAALGAMRQDRADRILDLLLDYGVNHIDTAADYGESETRIGPWMKRHRDDFFLATKTAARDRAGARESIHRSLDRLQTDRIDLLQLHNLVEPEEWEQALSSGGALEAAVEARQEGLVRFIGVTGHGTRIASMHRRSLERFAFDSVLLPYNFSMMSNAHYANDFDDLCKVCGERNVAVQTIKSIARRRWQGDGAGERRFSWYEPIRDPRALSRSVAWVLSRPDVFLNTSSDATLLQATLDAALDFEVAPAPPAMEKDVARLAISPLFAPGENERI